MVVVIVSNYFAIHDPTQALELLIFFKMLINLGNLLQIGCEFGECFKFLRRSCLIMCPCLSLWYNWVLTNTNGKAIRMESTHPATEIHRNKCTHKSTCSNSLLFFRSVVHIPSYPDPAPRSPSKLHVIILIYYQSVCYTRNFSSDCAMNI